MIRAVSSLAIAIAIGVCATAACGEGTAAGPGLVCAPDLTPSCSATYDPATFPTIYAKILEPNCATGNGTCHTADGRKAGLAFVTEEEAYGLLLGTNSTKRVVPGDYNCSLIIERLTSKNPDLHMPPGPNSLSAPDLCTIVKWIADGAPR